MEIKALENGMIYLDNGKQISQMRPERITSMTVFPPDKYLKSDWHTQVSGEGWISFECDTREEALSILETVNVVLDSMKPEKKKWGKRYV